LTDLERAIARSKRHRKEFAVCFVDLDRFKTINDTLGHEAGDELLITMALRLRSAVRESDLVARLGGDEFVVLLEGSASVDIKVSDLNTAAQKLLTAMGEPIDISGNTFLVTGSMGIALYPRDGDDCITLLRRADAAMYLAKDKGKNNVQFYTAELADLAAQQFELESALRLALVRDEFVLHFQPKIDIPSGVMIGVEALVRWLHP
jgi:diguanylate cyclase (GGDEF)-like protein